MDWGTRECLRCAGMRHPAASSPCTSLSLRSITQMRLALFQPDIPQNTGALLRLGACLGVAVDLIEPLRVHSRRPPDQARRAWITSACSHDAAWLLGQLPAGSASPVGWCF